MAAPAFWVGEEMAAVQRDWIRCSCYRDCNFSSLTIFVVHIESKGKASHAHSCLTLQVPSASSVPLEGNTRKFGAIFHFARSRATTIAREAGELHHHGSSGTASAMRAPR